MQLASPKNVYRVIDQETFFLRPWKKMFWTRPGRRIRKPLVILEVVSITVYHWTDRVPKITVARVWTKPSPLTGSMPTLLIKGIWWAEELRQITLGPADKTHISPVSAIGQIPWNSPLFETICPVTHNYTAYMRVHQPHPSRILF